MVRPIDNTLRNQCHNTAFSARRLGMALAETRRFRLLAAEALAVADQMNDPACRRLMICVAASYERLADHAEQRAVAGPSPDSQRPVTGLGGRSVAVAIW
jgi:hypothetical protein